MANQGLIEASHVGNCLSIDGITAEGSLILSKFATESEWCKTVVPIIEEGLPLTLASIAKRVWYRRLWTYIKEIRALLPF
jgi:hypothetical protein